MAHCGRAWIRRGFFVLFCTSQSYIAQPFDFTPPLRNANPCYSLERRIDRLTCLGLYEDILENAGFIGLFGMAVHSFRLRCRRTCSVERVGSPVCIRNANALTSSGWVRLLFECPELTHCSRSPLTASRKPKIG